MSDYEPGQIAAIDHYKRTGVVLPGHARAVAAYLQRQREER